MAEQITHIEQWLYWRDLYQRNIVCPGPHISPSDLMAESCFTYKGILIAVWLGSFLEHVFLVENIDTTFSMTQIIKYIQDCYIVLTQTQVNSVYKHQHVGNLTGKSQQPFSYLGVTVKNPFWRSFCWNWRIFSNKRFAQNQVLQL